MTGEAEDEGGRGFSPSSTYSGSQSPDPCARLRRSTIVKVSGIRTAILLPWTTTDDNLLGFPKILLGPLFIRSMIDR